MKDFLGVELKIGDKVAMIAPNYRHMVKGKISDITPKRIRVVYINDWNFGKPGVERDFLTDSNQVIKIN